MVKVNLLSCDFPGDDPACRRHFRLERSLEILAKVACLGSQKRLDGTPAGLRIGTKKGHVFLR